MISKNEESCIERCIRSVLPIVSDIVVVDTGSEDRTVEIVRDLGARVYSFPWTGSFAEARNVSLCAARGDWILVLDADECIAAEALPALSSLTANPPVCWEFFQRHYTDDYRLSNFMPCRGEHPDCEGSYAGYFESSLVRLIPNHQGLHYRGLVHELLEHSIRDLGRQRIARSEIRIHHYGHTAEVKKQKKKGALYTPLGEAKVKANPEDWKSHFELGVECNNNALYAESEQAFLEAARLFPGYLLTWVNLGYVQCELGKYEAAEKSLTQALKIDPRSEEALCNLGVVSLRSSDLATAERMFRKAVAVNSLYFNAYSNLAITLAQAGRLSETAQIFKRMIELFPSSPVPRQRLLRLYLSAGLPRAAAHLSGEQKEL
jgi:Flp pilus assembly protein TadD